MFDYSLSLSKCTTHKKAHQKLIIITTVLRNVCDVHTSWKKINKKNLSTQHKVPFFYIMKKITWYISCKIHVAHRRHTYHTQDSYYHALIAENNKKYFYFVQKYCVPSFATKLTMLVTVCWYFSPSEFKHDQHWHHCVFHFCLVNKAIKLHLSWHQKAQSNFLPHSSEKKSIWIQSS